MISTKIIEYATREP